MPEFWQFPTVSMGLGPLMAIYQARFLKYLGNRGWPTPDRGTCGRSWVTGRWTSPSRWVRARWPGGEAGQPDLRGELQPAAPRRPGPRQREDHPGAGGRPGRWLERHQGRLGSGWDPLLAADKSGLLLKRMEECVDGEYQDFKSKNGAYVREHFFGKYPSCSIWSRTLPTTRSGRCRAAGTTRRRSTRPTRRPWTTSAPRR